MVVVAGWFLIPDEIAHTSLGYYAELRKLDIDLHKYFLAQRLGRPIDWFEAESDWSSNYRKRFNMQFKSRLQLISDRLAQRDLSTLQHKDVSELVYGQAA